MPIAETRKRALAAPHRVVALAYDGLCTFEFGIVVEMFGLPRPELDSWYSFSVCGLEKRAIRAAAGRHDYYSGLVQANRDTARAASRRFRERS
jgi:hypothetical protein